MKSMKLFYSSTLKTKITKRKPKYQDKYLKIMTNANIGMILSMKLRLNRYKDGLIQTWRLLSAQKS